ncbi:hypothetical protein [Pseudoruegeria sp. SK021]|uniref:hypothetical protein n=1 Tax=Pseudoruegeria sp. SK021 TaxID=1933035 RepID=UPI000A239425|nr:hypothetical protein [Pseudoruegeria sp. SK021]OSP55622.1 hypothetical protein BV911_07090 [Pseudoruegeria sp. SK021]
MTKQRALQAIDQARTLQEECVAGIKAVESVVGEIATGTMRVDPNTGKVRLDKLPVVWAAPKPLRDRLMEGAVRLVRRIHETETRSSALDRMMERVQAWLRRDDLTETAREEGEELHRDGPGGLG